MVAITVYGVPLAPVTPSKYLGRVLSASYNNWTEVFYNLRRAQKKWERLSRVLYDADRTLPRYLEGVVFFLESLLRIRFLVKGCLGGASNWTNLQVHFLHRHVRDTIVILEEGNQP